MLTSKAVFKCLMREILLKERNKLRMTSEAVMALQEMSEVYLVNLFEVSTKSVRGP